MRKCLVLGNWKMYVESPEEAHALALGLRRKARESKSVEVGVAPPFPFIADVAKVLESSPIKVGAQTLSPHTAGAHTGEVSAQMLKQAGALFAIIGHSERRALPGGGGENNEAVRASLERSTEAGLMPVLCVGEREREVSGEHFEFIEGQLGSALKNIPKNTLKKLVIAYEPVWAIGKEGSAAIKSEDLEEIVIFIRKILADLLDRSTALKTPILYGGSVEPSNAGVLIKGGVNGFLVGRASAKLEDFLAIIKACQN